MKTDHTETQIYFNVLNVRTVTRRRSDKCGRSFIYLVLIMNRENGRWKVITDGVQVNGPNIDVGSI